MTRRASLMAVVLLFCSLTLPAWGQQQYYLYEPKPVTSEEQGQGKEGVLITEVPVQKGDTLYGISRKFSGHGMYYPQILLFNKINNPNLIYPGKTLKVPVMQAVARTEPAPVKESTRKSRKLQAEDEKVAKPKETVGQQPVASSPGVAPVTEISLSDLKALDEIKPSKHINKKKTASQGSTRHKKEKIAVTVGKTDAVPSHVGDAETGQKLFERAVKAYRLDDFSAALELFDRYLVDNSSSPLAADASLYKAECYLKLSSQ